MKMRIKNIPNVLDTRDLPEDLHNMYSQAKDEDEKELATAEIMKFHGITPLWEKVSINSRKKDTIEYE
jgi:hypothetical protein